MKAKSYFLKLVFLLFTLLQIYPIVLGIYIARVAFPFLSWITCPSHIHNVSHPFVSLTINNFHFALRACSLGFFHEYLFARKICKFFCKSNGTHPICKFLNMSHHSLKYSNITKIEATHHILPPRTSDLSSSTRFT